jgi:hypothetical protein
MKKDKLDQAMWHCYRQLFAHSTPPANFDELVANATENELGQKEIPYMNYEISEDQAVDIVEQTIKDFKIKNEFYAKAFRASIYLGCSPKFKRDDKDRDA